MVAVFGEKVAATVCSDAPWAIDMAHRQGLGKTRHIEEGQLTAKKAGTNNKPNGPRDKSHEWRKGNEVHCGDGF